MFAHRESSPITRALSARSERGAAEQPDRPVASGGQKYGKRYVWGTYLALLAGCAGDETKQEGE